MEVKNRMNVITLTISVIFLFTGCTALPGMFDDIEKIADNDAITIKVDKDALQQNTDVKVTIDVLNKDIKQP